MTKRLNVAPIPWPFWCLALAWLCANLPSASGFDFAASLRHFQQFSHQAALSSQALALLQAKHVAPSETAVAEATSAKAPTPPPTTTETVKKLELGTAPRGGGLASITSKSHVYVISLNTPPDEMRAEPPHHPPKRFWVS